MNRNQLEAFRFIGASHYMFLSLIPAISKSDALMKSIDSDEESKAAFTRISQRLSQADSDKCLTVLKEIHSAFGFGLDSPTGFVDLLDKQISRGVEHGVIRLNNVDKTVDITFVNELSNDEFRVKALKSNWASFDTTLEELVTLFSPVRTDIDLLIGRALLPLLVALKTDESALKMTELNVISTLEAGSYWKSKNLLGAEIESIQSLTDGYDFLLQQTRKLDASTLSAEQMVLMQYFAGERAELSAGVLALLRGHSLSCTRRALEFALFSLNLIEREGAALAWLKANQSAEQYKNYRDHFNIIDMLHLHLYEALDEDQKPLVQSIIERYETCCTQVHATLLSLAESIEIIRKEKTVDILFHMIDRNRGLNTIRKLIWLIDTHIIIFRINATLLSRVIAEFDSPAWKLTLDSLTESYGKIKMEWKPKFFPNGLPEAKRPVWYDEKDPKRKRKKIKKTNGEEKKY